MNTTYDISFCRLLKVTGPSSAASIPPDQLLAKLPLPGRPLQTRSKHVRHVKGPTDFATEADVMAESAILATLTQHRPDDARTGEESGSSGGVGSTRRWLIDPLCGTLNFAATTPLVSVNVALSEAGRTTVAAVADPIADELFWTDAHHVWSTRAGTDQFVRPSVDSMLVEINCDGPIDRAFVGGQLVADARLRAVYGPRVVSSTLAVCWVAAGRRTAYVSERLLPS